MKSEIEYRKFWLAVYTKDLLKLTKIIFFSYYDELFARLNKSNAENFFSYSTRNNRGRTMRDGKLSKVTLETRIRANVRKNGGSCSTLRYIFSSWMRENIHDVQSSCFIFLFPFFWVVCYFIWLRVQCNLFHPILFHPISLTIFSKPCICHVVTRMTMNTWVWQRIFPILYFMPWN